MDFGPYELWQADLNDMCGLSKFKDNMNYLLTDIDEFSKRLNVKFLKRKDGSEVTKALEKYLRK